MDKEELVKYIVKELDIVIERLGDIGTYITTPKEVEEQIEYNSGLLTDLRDKITRTKDDDKPKVPNCDTLWGTKVRCKGRDSADWLVGIFVASDSKLGSCKVVVNGWTEPYWYDHCEILQDQS